MLTFFKWFALFTLLAFVVAGILGGLFAHDFESGRVIGRIAGYFIWPLVLIASTIMTLRARAQERHGVKE
jgi:EamA domain-containing membrane protein RarD